MTIHMYDSIEMNLPTNAQAIAGYVGGSWPTYYPFVKAFPALAAQHRVLSVAINAWEHARCLDVEAGDAVASQVPGWLHNFADRSSGKPVIYTSASNINAVIAACNAAGIHRNEYLIWSAHYEHEHICGPGTCGYSQADGTQFNDVALGRNLDESVLLDAFFPNLAPAPYPIERFPAEAVPVPSAWAHHPDLAHVRSVSERQAVTDFRKLSEHPWANRTPLHVVRQELAFLRKRVWTVAHMAGTNHPPTWGTRWRGWRWHEMADMTKHVKQEW